MKFLISITVSLGIFAFVIFAIFSYANSSSSSSIFSSPLPNEFSRVFYKPQKESTYWMPNMKGYVKTHIQKPEISALAALSYDLSTNNLLYEKNIDEKLPIASLTKIMTAIVGVEVMHGDSKIVVSKNAASIGEDSMGLSEGETLTLNELLYGLFLHSGNDAAEAIADSSSVGRDNFIHLMNKKAEDLGLASTHFTNPSGLEGDGNQYSTAHDLLVIVRYALENPTIATVVKEPYMFIPYTPTHKAFELFNETNLLTSYPGVKGVKTGFTNEAGLCLTTYLDYRGHRIIAILLNSQNRRQEMKELLDYSLLSLGVTPPVHE
ncbi:MAG TPA: D-alanyl-D-alanine carboxypeptidase family protein [Candidatus Levybacteria bacterium]|nr:D-alanyl-D-alanine carboxypeptidase family protein [Candidatus Levybacteria bacterium]